MERYSKDDRLIWMLQKQKGNGFKWNTYIPTKER